MQTATKPIEGPDQEALPPTTQEELLECARLLAVSVAHHRAKFGIVPLPLSVQALEAGDSTADGLKRAVQKTFAETLDLVRQRRAKHADVEQAHNEPESDERAQGQDKRRQLRLSVSAPVKVSDPEGKRICPATLRNISWGGAAVRCDDLPVEIGGRARLLLPEGGNAIIDVEVTVLREVVVDGEREFGMRFESLDPQDEDRLQNVLKILLSSSDDKQRRSEVRLVQRLEVEYGDAGEFRATLEDISANGLSLTIPDPLEIDQSLLVSLSSADTPFGLNLRARVRHQKLIEGTGIEMYRVGLQFEHPNEQLHERITAVVEELALMRPRYEAEPKEAGAVPDAEAK